LKKQSGGSGLFADMEFELGPADEEFLESEEFKNGKTKLEFDWAIVGGAIDKNYQKPIKDGFKAMMENGILAGYSIDSMKVRVYDGLCTQWIPSQSLSNCVQKKVSKQLLLRRASNHGADHEAGGITPEEFVGL
jgi:translation elongation factor EF-G